MGDTTATVVTKAQEKAHELRKSVQRVAEEV